MSTSFGALCTDFYINQKLALKMDLPTGRETVLDLFDRIRREFPQMDRFRRYDGELALEAPEQQANYSWLALRRTSVRSGWVNPQTLEEAYRLHQLVLEVVPYYLSVPPIDIEFLELVFGFDLRAERNRNEVVFEALLADSPLASMIENSGESVIEAQPFLGFAINTRCDVQAYVEIKTRTRTAEIAAGRFDDEPISVYLTVRQYGSLKTIDDVKSCFAALAGHSERLAEERLLPHIILPLRDAILAQ